MLSLEEQKGIFDAGYEILEERNQLILTKIINNASQFFSQDFDKDSEVFFGRIPPCVKILELLNMASALEKPTVLRAFFENGNSKGYMFATYQSNLIAKKTVDFLDGHVIRPSWHLGVQLAINFRRIYIKNINAVMNYHTLITQVHEAGDFSQMWVKEHLETKQNSLVIEYVSHTMASQARKYMEKNIVVMFNPGAIVEWSKPLHQINIYEFSVVCENIGSHCLISKLTITDYLKLEMIQRNEFDIKTEAVLRRNPKTQVEPFIGRNIDFSKEVQFLGEAVVCKFGRNNSRHVSPSHSISNHIVNSIRRHIVKDGACDNYEYAKNNIFVDQKINQMEKLMRPITNNRQILPAIQYASPDRNYMGMIPIKSKVIEPKPTGLYEKLGVKSNHQNTSHFFLPTPKNSQTDFSKSLYAYNASNQATNTWGSGPWEDDRKKSEDEVKTEVDLNINFDFLN